LGTFQMSWEETSEVYLAYLPAEEHNLKPLLRLRMVSSQTSKV